MSFDSQPLPLEIRMLGQTPLEDMLQLQASIQRSQRRAAERRITVLLCEHPRLVTIGRHGSRADIRLTDAQLRRKSLETRWVPRAGGSVLHGPGQIGLYAIASLNAWGRGAEAWRATLASSILAALERLHVDVTGDLRRGILWGRSGILAVVAARAYEQMAGFGAYLNVNPDMRDYAYVDAAPIAGPHAKNRTMGSLMSETRSAGRMVKVRSALVESLAEAFGAPRYHLLTGHPDLGGTRSAIRAG